MGIAEIIAISMGVAWASGINLYATLATLGLLGATGNIVLPPDLEILAHPWVIASAGFMYCVEFFADKTPGFDTAWDTVHTFIRIPAGAVLAAMAVGEVSPAAQVAALILGGGLAATSHTIKAGSRVLINSSPEPFSNWGASLLEDVLAIGGVCIAMFHPVAFFVLLAVFAMLSVWLLPKIWRGVRWMFTRLREFFRGGGQSSPTPAPRAGGSSFPYTDSPKNTQINLPGSK